MKISSRLKGRRGLIMGAVLVVAACLVVVSAVPRFRWRTHVILLHVTGQIPDIELKQTLAYMMPGSDQWMQPLIWTRNPYAVVRNYRAAPADIQVGAQLFRSRCAVCHSPDGSGGRGGPLVGRKFKNGDSDWAVYRTIRLGIPNTAMTAHELPDTQLWQLIGYLRSIDVSGRGARAGDHVSAISADVS